MTISSLRVVNKDLIDVTEITNSITSKTTGTVSEPEFEQLLCYNLLQSTLPYDLSSNIRQEQTLSVTGGKEKLNGIMINNNEDLFDSELIAMKFSYTTNATTTFDEPYYYSMGTTSSSTIVKKGSTVSYESSALKITVDYNNDQQYSLDQYNDTGDWRVQFTRDRDSLNNYFAAVNSNLNTSNGSYPMYVTELTSDDYIINDGRYISSIDTNTKLHNYSTFESSYNLLNNNLNYDIQNNHSYESSDFTMYKIVQPTPTISLNISTDASNLPISDSSNVDISLSQISLSVFEDNVASVLGNHGLSIDDIKDGFQIEIDIAYNFNGGLSIEYNNHQNDLHILDISTNNIVDSNELLASGLRPGSEDMYVVINNGSLDLSGNDISSNVLDLGLSSEYEYLDFSYNTQNGSVSIYVEPTNSRVNIDASNNLNDIADSINVFYNCSEALAYDPNGCSVLDNSMCINPHVNLGAGIVVPTTDVPLNQVFTANDERNFQKSDDTILTISNVDNYSSGMITYSDVSFVSNISSYFPDTDIVFISVTNKNILSEDTPLTDMSNIAVEHSLASVSIKNLTFANLTYDDYKIRLDNKRISIDLSNSTQVTNGWYLESTNGIDFLTSNPIKTSILYDDCLFMRSNLDTSFNYTFSIATPTVTNAQSIKHRIDICYNDVDISNNGSAYLTPKYAYLDDNDITYSVPSVSDVSINFTNYTINNNVPQQIDLTGITVKRVESTVRYTASFEPKLPFYTNIKLQSPLITETVVSYRLFDRTGKELPDLYLKYLKDSSQNSLSLVTVSQPQVFSTTLNVSPSGCSTLKGKLFGSIAGTLYEIPNSGKIDPVTSMFLPYTHVDPFFNTESTIDISGANGLTSVVNMNVQVTYPTILSKEYYMIDTTTKVGENVSFETTLYRYDTNDHNVENSSFDAFNPYNSDWVDYLNNGFWWNKNWNNNSPPTPTTLRNVVTIDENKVLTLTIYDGSDNVISTLQQPNTLINDFNIIRCLDPLVITYYEINYLNEGWGNWNTQYTTATNFGGNRKIYVADGVYLTTDGKNPVQYSWVDFNLKPDKFSLQFVDGYSYINNGWDISHNFTDILQPDINNGLTLSVNSISYNNYVTASPTDYITRSVTFNKYRGYNRVGINGVDNITIVRKPSTAIFTVDTSNGIFTQTFNNFANNQTYVINNAIDGSGNSFNFGLKINGRLSLLQGNNGSDTVNINVQGASVYYRFHNSDNTVDYDYSTTLLDSPFNELFGWKARRIFSDYYAISITYNIPEVEYYNLVDGSNNKMYGPEIYGNPISKTNWGNQTTSTFTTSGGFINSGIEIYRSINYVEKGFTSYVVVTPPQMMINYNLADVNVLGFPYNPGNMYGQSSPHYLKKFYYFTVDSVYDSQYYVPILPNGSNATLINDKLKNIQKYKPDVNSNLTTYVNRFKIVGNYLAIEYYSGTYHSYDTPSDYVFSEYTIDKLLTHYNSNKLRVAKQSGTTIYDIEYRQFIGTGENQNSNFNIKFSISDAFLATPPAQPSSPNLVEGNSLIISLTAPASTVAAFYQANIKLIDSSFILVVDKYETIGIDYPALNSIISEAFFIADKHWTSSFSVDGTTLNPIGNNSYGDSFDVSDLFRNVQSNQIQFIEEISFNKINTGFTLTALSATGVTNLTNLVTYDSASNLISKSLYLYTPDIIRVNSMFGLPIYRVSNYGNVKTGSITAYSFNIASPTKIYDASMNSFTNDIQQIINTIPVVPSNGGRSLN